MKPLLDEMYSVVVAEQLRARGHDVVAVKDADFVWLAGVPDEIVYEVAVAQGRALVTEDVGGFRRIEATALAEGKPRATLIFTSNRQFPRRGRATGRLISALEDLLNTPPSASASVFLQPTDR